MWFSEVWSLVAINLRSFKRVGIIESDREREKVREPEKEREKERKREREREREKKKKEEEVWHKYSWRIVWLLDVREREIDINIG